MAELLLVNPRRRRRSHKKARRRRSTARRVSRRRRRHVMRVANPRRRRRSHRRVSFRRRRSNPSFRISSLRSALMPSLKAGFVGSIGAIGLDLVLGQVLSKLPLSLQSGWGKVAVKLAGALGVGMLGGYVMKGRARDLTVGAMTVTLHDVMKEQFVAAFPTIPLGEYLTFAPTVGYGGGTALPGNTMGEYMNDYQTGAGDVAYDPSVYGGY